MKHTMPNKYTQLLIVSACFLLLTLIASCSKDEPRRDDMPPAPTGTSALYILNEGLFNMNNATLTYCNFNSQILDYDYFNTINKRGLGDTGNELKRYGNKLYCIMTTSSTLEIFDIATGMAIKQIPFFFDKDGKKVARQPRSITFYEGKAYVCSFDNTVARIDTSTLEIDAYTTVGRNPDGICATNGKLYVSNSGGLDNPNYDNTVSVVDIQTFSEVKKITVGTNPYTIAPDSYGNVYVCSRGNYGSKKYALHRIDVATDEMVETFDLEVLNFTISGSYAYLYSYDFSGGESWVKLFNLSTRTVERENFVTDGTTLETPHGISVDDRYGYVYITQAYGGYVETGDVLCFSSEGKLQFKMPAGLNPKCVIPVY